MLLCFRLNSFSCHFRFIYLLLLGIISFFHNIGVFKVEVFLLLLWAGVVDILGFYTFVWFYNFLYHICYKIIQLLALGRAFLGALEPYVTCSAATSGLPSQLHGFGLCLHHLKWVHIVSRSMQKAHRLVFLFRFFIWILFRGFRGLVWPFSLRRLGILVLFTGLFGFLFWWFP